MTRTILKIALSLLLALPLAGCWDRTEMNDTAILLMATLFKDHTIPGNYLVRVHLALPTVGGGGAQSSSPQSNKYTVVEESGKDVEEVRLNIEKQLSRDLLTTHRRVYLVSEEVAREGLQQVYEQISRSPKNRLRTLLLIARETEAPLDHADTQHYPLESFPYEGFREMINRKIRTPSMLRDVFAASAADGIEPVAAAITIKNKKKVKAYADSIALFRDYRVVGFVTGNEATALNCLLGVQTVNSVHTKIPNVPGKLSIQVDHMTCDPHLTFKEDNPEFTFRVRITGLIYSNGTKLDFINPTHLQQLNTALQKQYLKTFQSLFHKLQKTYKTDNAGLGALVYRKNPKLWKKIAPDWEKIYPNVNVKVEPNVSIRRIGNSGVPFYLEERDVKH